MATTKFNGATNMGSNRLYTCRHFGLVIHTTHKLGLWHSRNTRNLSTMVSVHCFISLNSYLNSDFWCFWSADITSCCHFRKEPTPVRGAHLCWTVSKPLYLLKPNVHPQNVANNPSLHTDTLKLGMHNNMVSQTWTRWLVCDGCNNLTFHLSFCIDSVARRTHKRLAALALELFLFATHLSKINMEFLQLGKLAESM